MMTLRWSSVIKLADNQHVWSKYPESCRFTSKSCYLSWLQLLLEQEGSARDRCSKQEDRKELWRGFRGQTVYFWIKTYTPSPCSVTIILPFEYMLDDVSTQERTTDCFHTFNVMACENADPFTRQSFLSVPSPNLIWARASIIRERRYTFSKIDQKCRGYWRRHRRW